MISVYGGVMLAMIVAMFLLLARGLVGPTVYDRILAANAFGTKTVLFIALLGFFNDRAGLFLDLALVYALINYVTTVAILKLVKEAQLG